LGARQKFFFSAELRLEPLEVEEKLIFQLLPRIDASWWEFGIPICGCVLYRDDERFCEGYFVASR
jgi:hypothetical protein